MPYVSYDRINASSSARVRNSGVGDRFGRLLQIGPLFQVRQDNAARPSGRATASMCVCMCDCGEPAIVKHNNLRSGNTKSCGCISDELLNSRRRIGKRIRNRSGEKRSPTKISWEAMWSRCRWKRNASYSRYGGRGISVCDRWSDFSLFVEDMGERPVGASLDRIDPNGDYCPENCRWATCKEQARNRTDNTRLTICGRSLCVSEWCEQVGAASDPTIRQRLKRGWPHELAVFG